MRRALALARTAVDEVPVGAVLVDARQTLLAEGVNRMVRDRDPTAHAEIVALRTACALLGNYRLPGATLYTTLEPCAMCAGAIVQARLAAVVYAARDPRAGAAGSVVQILQCPSLNHRLTVREGPLIRESGALLRAFFQERR